MVVVFLFWRIGAGYRVFSKLPAIVFTDTAYEFHLKSGGEYAGLWRDIDEVSDQEAKLEIYLHRRAATPLIVSTKGLDASHRKIVQTAKQFLQEATRSD